jgi:PAS domain S-box-containing protein
MKNPIRISLRGRLLALVLLALLPAFALIIYNTIDDHQRAEAEVKQTGLRLVRLAAQNHEQMIDDAHDLLSLLTRFSLVLLDRSACQSLLEDLSQHYPHYTNFLVLDAEGTVSCSARTGYAGVNYADRQWFKDAVGTRKFVASEYLVGRVTSKPSVVFAAPLLDSNGSVQAVVSVSTLLEWLNRMGEHAQLPAGSTFTLLDANGTVLARHPETEKWIGRLYDHAHLVRTILTQDQEATTESAGLDGIDRLYAFKPLGVRKQVRAWHLAVGIPKEAAYGEIRAVLGQNLFFLAIVALLVLAAAWWGSHTLVLRPLRALVETSAKLGKGDLSARTGTDPRQDEIGQLAAALDQMAEAIEARESDRRSAEQTRAQLAAIVESSSDAIVSRTIDGTVTSWNKGAENLFGYTAEEMIGNSIMLLVPGDQVHRVAKNFDNIKHGHRIGSCETVRLKKSGAPIDVSVTISPIVDGSGKVIGASSITRDISAHKRSERELKALHDINLAISSTLDRQAILQILLEKIEVLLPYAASHIRLLEEATGKLEPVACRNLDEEQWKSGGSASHHVTLRTIIRSKQPVVIRNLQTDERTLRRSFYHQQGLVSYLGMPLIVKDKAIGVLSLLTRNEHEFTDAEIRFAETLAKQASIAISNSQLYQESKKLLDELAVSEEQIRALANGLMHAQDQEAKRITHVLHDESGQLLAMVYIALDELAKRLDEAGRERVGKIKGLLDEVENRLRDLSHELHPAMLDHLGLLPSLEHLAHQIAKRAGIQITVEGKLNERLSPLLELTIYRVVQEAFNNVVRHASARLIQVRVLQDKELIQCAIQDDGVGFDPAAVARTRRKQAKGLGLPGMRERVEAVGGIFQIMSAPGEGSKVFLSIPWEQINGSPSFARR